MARLTLRIDFDNATRLGPGKVRLLELIHERGSIAAAGRAMGMSYRRAWLLVDSLNRGFREPLVETQPGGSGGGGAALSPFGLMVLETYRTLEREAAEAVERRVQTLEQVLADDPPGPM